MKYLKKYKLFESKEDRITELNNILEDVKNILVDLEDDHNLILEYITNGTYHKEDDSLPFPSIIIIVECDDIFSISKIIDILKRIESYVTRSGFKIDAELSDNYTSLDEFIEEYEDVEEEICRMDLIIY